MAFRIEKDTLGEVQIPADAPWGAQTQRALENFAFPGRTMSGAFIQRLALLKAAAATANAALGVLESDRADAIVAAALAIGAGEHGDAFPVTVFQTGSGTSTNMNMNEVIAHLAGNGVHPNDHVNASQSSNDVIPTTLQVATALELRDTLLPALSDLSRTILEKAEATDAIAKTGRTHLMDAMPVTFGQVMRAWLAQINDGITRLDPVTSDLCQVPLGGTAVGTGVNCPQEFPELALAELSRLAGMTFTPAPNPASRMSGQEPALAAAAAQRGIAATFTKIANDLRWMASGPLAGLAEIELKALQPGSSIMPGKVNPVLPESVLMMAAEVMGNDQTVMLAAQSGNFELNVMLPLIADKLLANVALLRAAASALAATIRDVTVLEDNVRRVLAVNPVLVTALNPHIGYEAAATIAKRAYADQRPVIDVAEEMTDLSRDELTAILDPLRLTGPEAE